MDFKNFNTTTLAKIWCTLNHWNWADELGDMPDGWDDLPSHSYDKKLITKDTIIKPYMDSILRMIGIKECLRYHNLNNLGFSNLEFENWWNKNKSTII